MFDIEDIIYKIFLEHQFGTIKNLDRLSGGDNIVYLVDFKQCKKIIRLNKYYQQVFQKEKWAMETTQSRGIKVPKVDDVGFYDGYDFIIMENIQGITASNFSSDRSFIYKKLGKVSAQINQIKTQGFGQIFVEKPSPYFTFSWSECIDAYCKYIFDKNYIEQFNLSQNKIQKLHRKINEAKNWNIPSALSHNDMSLDNIIITEDSDIVLIDWSNVSGQPITVTDLGDMLSMICGHTIDNESYHYFVEGYGIDQQELKRIQESINLKALIHAAMALRWALEDSESNIALSAHRLKYLTDTYL